MLSNRCKFLGGVIGLALLIAGSSPAFAQQQAKLTQPGDPSSGVIDASVCEPWCTDSLSNQPINDQTNIDAQTTQTESNNPGNSDGGGGGGGGLCDIL